MVAYSFKPYNADDVASGAKRQTIRAGSPRCKVGSALQLYTGQRTKKCRKLRDAVCTLVRRISISEGYDSMEQIVPGDWKIVLDGKWDWASDKFSHGLARCDGFEDAYALCRWFEAEHGLPFHGHVVNW